MPEGEGGRKARPRPPPHAPEEVTVKGTMGRLVRVLPTGLVLLLVAVLLSGAGVPLPAVHTEAALPHEWGVGPGLDRSLTHMAADSGTSDEAVPGQGGVRLHLWVYLAVGAGGILVPGAVAALALWLKGRRGKPSL